MTSKLTSKCKLLKRLLEVLHDAQMHSFAHLHPLTHMKVLCMDRTAEGLHLSCFEADKQEALLGTTEDGTCSGRRPVYGMRIYKGSVEI